MNAAAQGPDPGEPPSPAAPARPADDAGAHARLRGRVPRAPDATRIQEAELSRLFGWMVALRAERAHWLALLPLAVGGLDPTPVRLGALIGGALAAVVWSRLERRRVEHSPHKIADVPRNVVVMSSLQALMIAATGGLGSVLLVGLLPLTIVSVLVLGRRPWPAPGLQIGVVLGLYVADRLGLLAPTPGSWLDVVVIHHSLGSATAAATVLCLGLWAASRIALAMRDRFDAMLDAATEARQDVLDGYAAQARELTTLSAEIAHELKNPLASVKGLGALLARDLPEGRPAQRLAVLRGEVDRMQGILEGFLNFSRPLGPLALELVDVAALGAEVAELHEGVARERGVKLRVAGAGSARCDARKVKQILVNLVQNALAVSPEGGVVTLTVAGGAPLRVQVEDEGPGLPTELGERVFEPGVTTRADGSGLGLTVSRALARQHGGELILEARAGRGCRAVLSLPESLEVPS